MLKYFMAAVGIVCVIQLIKIEVSRYLKKKSTPHKDILRVTVLSLYKVLLKN